jgi:hypothetical protein
VAGIFTAPIFISLALAVAIYQSKFLHTNHLPHISVVLIGAAIVCVGLCSLLAADRLQRPMDASTDEKLRKTYLNQMFTWIGFSSIPMYLSVAVVIVTATFWLYPIGAVFAMSGCLWVAPTNWHLNRVQGGIAASGGDRSIRDALYTMPTRR